MRKLIKALKIASVLVMVFIIQFAAIDLYVINSAGKYETTADRVKDVDCIIVLGAMVYPNGWPSGMLKDRLLTAIDILKYNKGMKVLVSGDNRSVYYNEVAAMKRFLVDNGVPGSDIYMDHAGLSTYETAYRAKEIFQVKSAVLVTQGYHLKRAVFDARGLGIDAWGVAADRQSYRNIVKYKVRESLAIYKDFFFVNILKPLPTYLGKPIPIK